MIWLVRIANVFFTPPKIVHYIRIETVFLWSGWGIVHRKLCILSDFELNGIWNIHANSCANRIKKHRL